MMRVIEKPEDLATVYADAQSAVTYDSMTGRFYYPSLGLYFDPVVSLFYDSSTGRYRDLAIAGIYADGDRDGLYYDDATGLYYDPLKKMTVTFDECAALYHDSESGLDLRWDAELNAFYDEKEQAYYDRSLGTHLIYDHQEQMFYSREKDLYYDSALGLYYDKSLGLFFDPLQNRYYDKETGEYCDPATGTRTVDAAGHLQFDDDAGYYFCDLDGHYYSFDMEMGLYLSCDYGTCGFRLYYDSQTCHHIVYDAMGCFYYEQETGSLFDPMTGRYYENSADTYYSYDAMRAEFVDEMTGAAYLPGNSMTCFYDQDLISISDGQMMGYGENATGLYYIWQVGLFFDGTCYYFDLERNITYYLDPLNGRYYDIETGMAYMTPPPNGGGWSSFSVDVSSMSYDEMYGMYYDAMTGRYYDDMLGLYYDGMSYYDPQTGNWCGFDMERGCYCDSVTGKAFLPIRGSREGRAMSPDSGTGHIDMSNMTYDEMMGMYYDNSRCCYYDDTVGLFYDGMSYFDQAGHYYWYDSMLNRYYDQMTGETFIPPSKNGSNGIDVSNMTYDEMWGMYYDSTLGYYYNAQAGLYFDGMSYYDPNTWRCYWYDSMCNRYYDSMTGEEFIPQASAGSNRLNLASMTYDEMWGMYYDPSTGYHFDATVNLYFDGMTYYDPQTWQCYYYDSMQDCYYDLMTGERYTPRDTVTGMSCEEIAEIQKTFRLMGDVMPYAGEYEENDMVYNDNVKTVRLDNSYCVAPFSASDAVWFDRLFSMGMDYSSKRIRIRANGMPLQLEIECQDAWEMSGSPFYSSGLFVEVSEAVWNRATRSVELTLQPAWSSMMGMGATPWNGNSMTYSAVDPRNGMYSSTVGIEGVDSEADFAAFAEYAGNWYYDSLFSMAIFRGCWSFGGGMSSEYGVPSFASTTTVGGFLDSDGDGLADIDEYGHGTNPFLYDTDGDGLNDALELRIGSCPTMFDSDSDGDGMADVWEAYFHLNAQNPVDANADLDQDGLINRDECFLGTNPLDEDTDGDGLRDGAERKAGTQPLNVDTDNDGLPDGSEIARGTNPLNPDTDQDGLLDGKEVGIGLDPTSVDTDRDGIADSDALLYKLTSAALSSYADQEAARRLKAWLPLDYADVDWDCDLDGVPDYVQYMVGSEPYSGFDVTEGHDGYPAAFILTLTVGEGELKFPGPVCVEIDGQKICLREAKTLTRWCKEGERHTVRIIAQQGARIPVRATCDNPRYAQHAVVIDDKEGALMNDCQPTDLSVYPCKNQHTVRTFDVFQPTVKIKDVICFHGDGENRQMKKTVESEICPKEFEGRVEWTIVEKEKEEGFRVEGDAVNVYRCHVGMTLRCKMTSEDGRLMELERSVVAKIGSCFHQDLDATQDEWCPVHNRAKKICDKLHGCVGFECDAMCQDRRSVGDMKHWDVTERTEPGSNGMTGTPTLEGLPEDGEPFFSGLFSSSSVALNDDDDNGNEKEDIADENCKGEDDLKKLDPVVPWAPECCKCPHHAKWQCLLPTDQVGVHAWLDDGKSMDWYNLFGAENPAYIEGRRVSSSPEDASINWQTMGYESDGNQYFSSYETRFTVYSLRLIPDLNRDGAVDEKDRALVPQMKKLELGWVVDTEQRHLFNLKSDVGLNGDISLTIRRKKGNGEIGVYSSGDLEQTSPICTLAKGEEQKTFVVASGNLSPSDYCFWLGVSEQGTTVTIEAIYQGMGDAYGYECRAKLKVTAPIFQIAGDGGVRDGKIDFNDPNDNNLMFWVNDDFDVVHFFEDMYQEDDDKDKCGKNQGVSCRNCDDDVIGAAEGKPNLNYLCDNENVKHYCFRDLEDFDRLHFHLDPKLLKIKGQLVYECRLRPIDEKLSTKKPQINLFPAVSSDNFCITGQKGRLTHQEKADFGNLLTPEANVGMLDPSFESTTEGVGDVSTSDNAKQDMIKQMEQRKILTIKQQWQVLRDDQVANEYNYFLYEGVESGKGILEFQVKLGNMILGQTSLTLDLYPVVAFTDTFAIDETDDTNASAMDEFRLQLKDVVKTSASASMPGCVADDETLLVLGWNVHKQEKEAWRDTVFKRLFWQGYRGRVGTFIWPSTYGFDLPLEFKKLKDVTKWRPLQWPRKLLRVKKNWDALTKSAEGIWDGPHFDRGEHRAWLSGVKGAEFFSRELENLSHLTFITHSQGNVVVGEMMRRLDPEAKRKISYLAFQGAISAQYYTTKFQAGKTIVKQATDKGEIDVDPYAMTPRDDAESLAYWGTLLNQIRWGEGTESEIEAPDIMGNFPRKDGPARPYLENVLTGLRNTANFYNRQDYALNVWLGNNATKPDNLRNIGFMDKSFGFKRGHVMIMNHSQDPSGNFVNDEREKFSTQGVFYQNSSKGEFAIFPGNRPDVQGNEYSIWREAMSQEGVREATAFFDGGECAKWCAFSFVVQSRSLAIGQLNMDSIFKSNYNLQEMFNFTEVHYDHSHEFRSSISDTWYLWGLVLSEIRKTK